MNCEIILTWPFVHEAKMDFGRHVSFLRLKKNQFDKGNVTVLTEDKLYFINNGHISVGLTLIFNNSCFKLNEHSTRTCFEHLFSKQWI